MGIRTRGMRSDRATAAACSGPAPPNPKRAKRRGSWPRSIETILIALAMFSLAISTIDEARSIDVHPRPVSQVRQSGFGQTRIERIRPPRK